MHDLIVSRPFFCQHRAMKKPALAILTFLLISSDFAFAAGPFLEPTIGVEWTTSKVEATLAPATPISNEFDNRGIILGGTFGWSFGWIAVGGEYQSSSLNQKRKPTGEIQRLDTSDLGINLQFMPLEWFKISASYFFDADSNDGYAKRYRGTGSRVGVGFRVISWLSINFDLLNIKYDRAETTGFTLDPFSLNRKGFLVGLSFPVGL